MSHSYVEKQKELKAERQERRERKNGSEGADSDATLATNTTATEDEEDEADLASGSCCILVQFFMKLAQKSQKYSGGRQPRKKHHLKFQKLIF